jgi:hypothetical protein
MSSAKIPAWKLLQQLRRNGDVPVALYDKDELGGSSSINNNNNISGTRTSHRSRHNNKSSNSIGTRSTKSTSTRSSASSNSNSCISSNPSCHTPSRNSSRSQNSNSTIRPVSWVPGDLDPSLPPAYRPAFDKLQQQRNSNININSNSNSDDDDSDSDSGDSFANLDIDADKDDDAYRVSRDKMAQLEIETEHPKRNAKTSRFHKQMKSIPLGLIAE